MKGNTMGLALLGLTLASALCTALLSVMTLSAMSQQQAMQQQAKQVREFRQTTAQLIEDSVIYGRKNPAILPLLEKFGIKPTANVPNASGK